MLLMRPVRAILFVAALAVVWAAAVSLSGHVPAMAETAYGVSSGSLPGTGIALGGSADETARWRSAGAVTLATAAASPWRLSQLHALLARAPVRDALAPEPAASRQIGAPSRPHAPPHFLNDSLLI